MRYVVMCLGNVLIGERLFVCTYLLERVGVMHATVFITTAIADVMTLHADVCTRVSVSDRFI